MNRVASQHKDVGEGGILSYDKRAPVWLYLFALNEQTADGY